MVFFDNFLTEALQQLRRFCLGSTIWYDVNQNGKHGSYGCLSRHGVPPGCGGVHRGGAEEDSQTSFRSTYSRAYGLVSTPAAAILRQMLVVLPFMLICCLNVP